MKITLATISPRKSSHSDPAGELLQMYISRSARYVPCEHRLFPTEAALLAHLKEVAGRTAPALILADSRGKQLSSEEFAEAVGDFQDNGIQQMILSIGPADGWSSTALSRANMTLAFGRITLPHELAAAIAAEQIYRALTIRAKHPYHSGH
jgi:23S rRNA (pseudouridine1915-N3)-methyltransferase